MRGYVLFSVVCLQLGWTYGEPAGVGVYAYQDSAGNRYGGTYGLDDAQFYGTGKLDDETQYYGKGKNKANRVNPGYSGQGFAGGWGNFMQPPFVPNFPQFDDFFPQYFSNLENLLQDITGRRSFDSGSFEPPLPFPSMLPPLRLNFGPLPPLRPLFPIQPFPPFQPFPNLAPLEPFEHMPVFPPMRPFPSLFTPFPPLRSSRFAPFPPLRPLPSLFPTSFGGLRPFRRFDEFGGFGNTFMSGANSAFAGAAAGPGFTHQIAALNPENPTNRNVNVMNRFGDDESPDGRKFYGVSSSSYASSSNINGQENNHRGAQTVVNNNGRISKYKIES